MKAPTKKKKKIQSIEYFLSFFLIMFLFGGMFSYTEVGAATRVFYDGFESGNANLWSDGGSLGKCEIVSSALDGGVGPLAGTKMARCNWDGTSGLYGHSNHQMVANWAMNNEALVRFNVRVDGDIDVKPGSKFFRMNGGHTYAAIQFEMGSDANLWTYFGSSSGQIGSTNWGTGGSFRNGTWKKIEVYIKKGTNGNIKLWVDDLLGWQVNGDVTDSTWNEFIMMSNWSLNPGWEHDANNHIYWDEFEVFSDSTSGTGTTGSMASGDIAVSATPDTTPPTSPTNLAATSPSQSSISVSWTASTDAVGVTGYIVERCQGTGCSNFTQVGTPTASPFVDSGLTANTFYNYHVRARDAANNLSGWSNVVGATTQSASPAASRVFYDDFENGTGAWSNDSIHNRCNAITRASDSGLPKAGSQMLRCNWNGTVAWDTPENFEALKLTNWPYTSEILVRFWIRRDANAADHPASGPKYYRIGGNGSFGAMHFVDGYQKLEMYSVSGQIGSTYWGGGSSAANGSWHKVELYIKDGTSNGTVRLWEDGTKLWEAINVNTTQTGSWSTFYITSNWSGAEGCCDHDATNHIYWDDFEVYSDSSSGTAATGSLSDASIQVSGSTPLPTINISANPTSITSGSSSTLTWSSTNATSCTASGSWTGTKATSGTQSVSPTSTSTYTLTCTGAGGNGNASATITVSNTSELIIDNTDTNTSQSGSWSPSTNFPGYYGTDYHYSPNATGHWFEWTATNLVAGTYEVYAYWNANTDRPTDVSYLITHSGGTATRNNINQTQNGSQWNLLGTYTFGTTGTVRVQSGGTGTEGTVADAIRFLKTNTTPCNTVTTSNFSEAPYNSYGAPFDAFQTSTNLVNTQCNSADTHTINLTTGVTGDTTRIIYTKGYWYDAVTTAWRQYTGTCTGALNGEWCQGSVSATITDPNISTASAANPTYLVGMTCSVQGGSWKCGCRDTSCTNFSWQIQGAGM